MLVVIDEDKNTAVHDERETGACVGIRVQHRFPSYI